MKSLNKKRLLRSAHTAAYIFIAMFCMLVVWLLLRLFVYSTFTIPSESMSPGIIPGDRVVVEKLSTGGRIFNVFDAEAGEKLNIRRIPGWREIRRDDVIVFNFVHRERWDTIEMNYPVYYLKRAVALPGDTFAIRDFTYMVNSDTLRRYPPKETFAAYYPSDSVARAANIRGYMVVREDTVDRWTVKDYGSLIVPRAGMTLPIDSITWRRYRQIIERETGMKLTIRNNIPMLDEDTLDSYTFKENYYFTAGDNALGSMDSRYWGLVPEEFIVGRAIYVYWSEKNGKIRWDRLLKRIE